MIKQPKNDLWGEPVEIIYKKCKECGKEKNLILFPFEDRGAYYKNTCKECSKLQKRLLIELRKNNPTPSIHYECPICLRKQKEIVKDSQSKRKFSWRLDHDHTTNQFRGWLCDDCNRALGNFKDDIGMLLRAIKYLTE